VSDYADAAVIAWCRAGSAAWNTDPVLVRARAESEVAREQRAAAARRAEINRMAELSAREVAAVPPPTAPARRAPVPPLSARRRAQMVEHLAALPLGRVSRRSR
jgi:hypothetical protein